ncbi:MAG: Tripartite-type tricarboxylate transporter, receptor component TctC [Ramlibacter sp.]|nr:Tripartite-type tricarboxylate transporter, receptor component TctC [Ramlibacter sp.]
MRTTLAFTLLAATLSCVAVPAAAQPTRPFPTKPVTLVVPFTPGSGSDTIARVIAPKLAAKWGQGVVVDNKPGASGNLGALAVAKAVPDGHTLLMAINTYTMTPAVYKNMPFDAMHDFAPITKLADADFALAVHPSLPVTDMRSLVAYAKGNPGRFNYASPGNGTPHHLAMELFKGTYGVFLVHVPYKGLSGALTDLMGGQVQMMFATVPSLRQHAQAGRVKLLGVTGAERSSLIPDVRTFLEQGLPALAGINSWYAVLAPARTPADLVARLNRDFTEVMHSDEVKTELAKQGITVTTGTPAQLEALVATDIARWQKVVSAAGIKPD